MMSMFSFLKVNTDFFLLEFVKSEQAKSWLFSEILSSRWLDRFCLLGIFKIVDSRWSGPILVLHYIFHAVLVSNGNNSEILSSVKKLV